MGRPTFKIDSQRLRALREEKCFTQKEVALKVSELLKKPCTLSKETKINNYQRIEKYGKTSRKMAEALSEIFEVSVGVLQGVEQPQPREYLQKLKVLLQAQTDGKKNPSLQREFARLVSSGEVDPLWCLAEDIGGRIEVTQLGRNPAEIAELLELTGLTESELLSPANVLGHWFLTLISPNCNRSDIVLGATEVRKKIKEIVGDYLDHFGSDGSIRMWRDGFWFRIEINRHQKQDRMRIDFVCCRPNANGLNWMQAHWQDEFYICNALANWAYSSANFVTNFEGIQSPQNLQQLRLVVTERMHTHHIGQDSYSQKKMVISGHLDEIPEETIKNFKQESSTHSLFQRKLVSELRAALISHLAEYPADYWKITADGSFTISLTPPRLSRGSFPDTLRYHIELVEEISPNKFVTAPWRNKDKVALQHEIEGWIEMPYSQSDEYSSAPIFETIESVVHNGPCMKISQDNRIGKQYECTT